jgi:NADH-quinone oxidoreductase subunit N
MTATVTSAVTATATVTATAAATGTATATAAALDNSASLLLALPELVLSAGVLLLLLVGLLRPRLPHAAGATLAVLVAAATAAVTLATAPRAPQGLFGGLVARDGFGDFFRLLAPLAAAYVALLSLRARDTLAAGQGHAGTGGAAGPTAADPEAPELFALLLTATLGVVLMASATDLLTAYLALELTSVMSYVLAGFTRGSRPSSEAALKYVIYGGVASGAFLYGLSLLYGVAGATELAAVRAAVSSAPEPLALVAAALCLAGLGYKVAVVPFHMWAPDVYQGAPTPVAAFLSVATKAGGFALLLRFLGGEVPGAGAVGGVAGAGAVGEVAGAGAAGFPWALLALVIAVVSMTLGNLAALGQRSVKRLLAYSSIAHAGYLFLGVAAGAPGGQRAVLFYLAVYLFMNLAAFAVVVAVMDADAGAEEAPDAIDRFVGLGRRAPLAALVMTVALVALAGLPPTGGFVGKYYLFSAAVARGREPGGGMFYVGALLGVLNSVVSLYYYARIVRAMYIDRPAAPVTAAPARLRAPLPALLLALALPVVALGLYWTPLDTLVDRSLARWSPAARAGR